MGLVPIAPVNRAHEDAAEAMTDVTVRQFMTSYYFYVTLNLMGLRAA